MSRRRLKTNLRLGLELVKPKQKRLQVRIPWRSAHDIREPRVVMSSIRPRCNFTKVTLNTRTCFFSKNFSHYRLNANEKKQGWSNSGGNVYYFVQYFEQHCLSLSECCKCGFQKLVRYKLIIKSL